MIQFDDSSNSTSTPSPPNMETSNNGGYWAVFVKLFCPCFCEANYPETPNDKRMHVAQAAKAKYQILTFVAKARYLLYYRVQFYRLCIL